MAEGSNGPTGCDTLTGGFGLLGKFFDIFGGAATANTNGVVAGINDDVAAHKQERDAATQAKVEVLLAEARVAESRTDAARASAISPNTYDMGNPAEKLS